MKRLFLFLLLSLTVLAQVSWTPPVAPSQAVPGKLVAISGTGATAISCTLLGNAVPATALTISCSLGATTIPSFTLPLPSGAVPVAFTYQFNFGANATTIMVSLTPGTAGIAFQATANAGTPITGTF